MNLKGNKALLIALVFLGSIVLATMMRSEHGPLGGVLAFIATWLGIGLILLLDHRQKQRMKKQTPK